MDLIPFDWKILHSALQALQNELMKWNQRVGDSGAKKMPYDQEVQDLHRIMISISRKLKNNTHGGSFVEPGVSIGSLRLKKAALILLLCRKCENMEDKKGEGWPSAALDSFLDSLAEEIRPIQELLGKRWFDYDPHEVLWQLISKAQYEKVVNLDQHSLNERVIESV